MNTLQVGPCSIAYQDAGRGTAVILVHCSSASHRMWKPLVEQLSPRYRVLAPDLIGYGDSDTWPADQVFDPSADTEIVLRLAALADGPVHIAAHSYGAAVALEAARQLDGKLRSLTLIEPVAVHLLRLTGRSREWDEISRIANRVRAAVAEGSLRSAAAIYMSYWIGRLRWWLMPNKQRRRIIETVNKVAAEFGALDRMSTPPEAYARISVPTRLVVGGRTRRPARAVVDVLLETMPNAHRHILPTAGHMSPFSHANEVHALIAEHIGRPDSRSLERPAANAVLRFP